MHSVKIVHTRHYIIARARPEGRKYFANNLKPTRVLILVASPFNAQAREAGAHALRAQKGKQRVSLIISMIVWSR